MALSKKDVERLMQDSSMEARQEVLTKVAEQYNEKDGATLSPEETRIVEDIFRALARSTEVEIRKTLAESVKNSPNLPKDIALKMANDIADVANPILQFSQVLSDIDLMEIMANTKDISRSLAIAKRENLSEELTSHLLEQGNEEISSTVFSSFGSKISEHTYNKLLDKPLTEQVVHAMVDKGSISVTITDKLLKSVSGKIRESLDEKYQIVFEDKKLKQEMENNLTLAMEEIIGVRSADAHNKKLQDELQTAGTLIPFTALSICNYQMFEVTMSRLTRVPLNNVRILIYDHGEAGLRRLCQKAGIPDYMFDLVAIAVRALQSFEGEALTKPRSALKPKDLLERIRLLSGGKQVDYLDFFISLMKPGQR